MKSSSAKPPRTRPPQIRSTQTRSTQTGPTQTRSTQTRPTQTRLTLRQAPNTAVKGTETIYGLHAVRVMLERHPERVNAVRVAERRDDPRVREIDELARRNNRPVQRVDAQVLKQQLGDVAHQGVSAEIIPLPPWTEDELVAALQSATNPLILALDGVQDPHNLGACLRTADACGALAVVVPRDRAAQVTPTVRKVAVGAAETTPVVAVTNLVRTLKLLQEAGLWVVGADAEGARLAHEVDLTGGIVLALGAEGTGLRHLTRQTCDWMVRLPQLGAVESLNVSVAAGMLLYETVRQRIGGKLAADGVSPAIRR
jgi:23S rRNA (guanosine2251-2'-O)-methyltransferase